MSKVVALVIALAVALVAPLRAQDAGPPPVRPLPQAPRLVYSRGPAACLTETEFRSEVAVHLDGVSDYFDAKGAAEVRVTFEKVPTGFRGTVEFTSATGDKEPPTVVVRADCHDLARWIGTSAGSYIPWELWNPPAAAAPTGSGTAVAPVAPTASAASSAAPGCKEGAECAGTAPFRPSPRALSVLQRPQKVRDFQVVASPEKSFLQELFMELTLGVSGLVLMTVGYTENVAPGFQFGGEALYKDVFSVSVEGRYIPPSKVVAREITDPSYGYSDIQEFEVSETKALLVPCLHFAKYFAGCGVVTVGVITRHSDDPIEPVDDALQATLGPRFKVELPVYEDRLYLTGFAEMLIPLPRQGWRYDLPSPTGNVRIPNVQWGQSYVSGFFAVGLAWRFR